MIDNFKHKHRGLFINYLKDRWNPKDIPPEIYYKSFQMVIDKFSEKWLEEDGSNPLQILWKKNDPLSFYELYSLGCSLISIKNNKKWLDDNIKKMKSENVNQIKGAFFEIFAAAIFNEGKNQTLIIPKIGTSGYDLKLKFDDDSKIDISCKNHGISTHETKFQESSLEFEKKFIEICKKQNIKLIQCRIYTKSYPEIHDWNLLNDQIGYILTQAKIRELRPEFDVWALNNWAIGISSIVSDHFTFNSDFLSYNILIVSPFHRNEKDNLYSNLDSDCDNLAKHG